MFKPTIIVGAIMLLAIVPSFAQASPLYCPTIVPLHTLFDLHQQGFDEVLKYTSGKDNQEVMIWENKNLKLYYNIEYAKNINGNYIGVCLEDYGTPDNSVPPPTLNLFRKN